jgi:hypothetical protein
VTESGISLEEFPAIVATYCAHLRAWLTTMSFFVIEQKHPPRVPMRSDYASPKKYREALARYDVEVAQRSKPYLPYLPPCAVIIAVDFTKVAPDFELVDDEPRAEGVF